MNLIKNFKYDYNLIGFRYAVKHSLPYWLLSAIDRADDLLFPKQKWLYKKLPRHYLDKDQILEICILECIKNFVEVEKCFERIDYSEDQEFANKLREYYKWITVDWSATEKEIEGLFNQCSAKTVRKDGGFVDFTRNSLNPYMSYNEITNKIEDLESQIDKKKTEIMIWAVENRGNLWT